MYKSQNDDSTRVSTSELERQIFEKEEIKVVIRMPSNKQFPSYPYQRKAANNMTVSEWIDSRIKPIIGNDVQIEIIKGDGSSPHGRTKMETVRNSYRN